MKRIPWLGLLILAGCASAPPAPEATTPAQSSQNSASNVPNQGPSAAGSFIPRGTDYTTAPQKIAFASCAHQNQEQPIWAPIVATEPDLFLFMGDNIYTSSDDAKVITEQYRQLNQIPGYREARQKIPFMATWDDGDYGTNNGGADAPTKAAAQQAFLQYWDPSRSLIPPGREGIYHSRTLGGLHTGGGGRRRSRRPVRIQGPAVHVIMLDTRSFRSPLKTEVDPETQKVKNLPNNDRSATVLGSAQWAWLENELKKPAELHIVVSSIQLIATEHPFEKWANFPRERERFLQLVAKTKPKNLLVLSGDRHMGSFARTEIKGWGTLYDITASSINRPSSLPPEMDPSYLVPSYNQENFGLAQIDWRKKTLTLEIRDLKGQVVKDHEIKLR